jgi:SAM-dependent methyltransferase
MRFLPRSYQQDWDRDKVPAAYGTETYEKPLRWLLETCDSIEDWGCGYGYARRFIPAPRYFGVDGSPEASPYADLICDLQDRETEVDGIFIRHILEHNMDWRPIMENAMKSFRKRLVLVLFTPFSDNMTVPLAGKANGLLDIAFYKPDIIEYFEGFSWSEEHLMTDSQYREEHIFYVSRENKPLADLIPSPVPKVKKFRFLHKNRSV